MSIAIPGACQISQAPETLTLQQAVALALDNNRELKNVSLDLGKLEDRVKQVRARSLPQLHLSVAEFQLLTPVDFRFRQGAFGTFPGIGPIPAINTSISTPGGPAGFFNSSVGQPLSELYKIRLGVRLQKLARESGKEQVRAKRQALVSEVKRAYFALAQTQSSLEASEEALKLYRELERVTERYVLQQVVLKSDGLEVKANRASQELQAVKLRNAIASQQEQLNLLMGRDIRQRFVASPLPEVDLHDVNLEIAQAKALEQRPEIKQAQLAVQQTEYDRRMKKADYIPNVSFVLQQFSFPRFQFLPQNVLTAGFGMTWEPLDWGRRKHEVAESEKSVEQARNVLRDTETKVLLEVNANFRRLQENAALIRVQQMVSDTAKERLRVLTNRYGVQAALLRQVLEAQANVAHSAYDYQAAVASYWSAKADLERAMGEN
jgi:outer membrane protein TolC